MSGFSRRQFLIMGSVVGGTAVLLPGWLRLGRFGGREETAVPDVPSQQWGFDLAFPAWFPVLPAVIDPTATPTATQTLTPTPSQTPTMTPSPTVGSTCATAVPTETPAGAATPTATPERVYLPVVVNDTD